MKAFIIRLSLAFTLLVGVVFGATGAPFTGQQVQGLSSPQELTGLAVWYDVSQTSSLLKAGGAAMTDGGSIALIGDQSGNSGVNCLVLNGVAGNYAWAADSVPVSIPGDIDLRVRGAANDWTPSAAGIPMSKWSGAGNQRSWIIQLNMDGTLTFNTSTNGVATSAATSSAAPSVLDFGALWIRITRAAATGTVTFYTSTDGSTWTQLGTTQATTSGALFDNTAPIEIGTSSAGVNAPLLGRIYRAQIYASTNGTDLRFDSNFATFSKLAATGTESSANAATVTIATTGDLGARISGERDLYQGTLTKQPVFLQFSGTKYGYGGSGIAGSSASTPNAAGNALSTSADFVMRMQMNDWTPGSAIRLGAKGGAGGSGQRAISFSLNTSGGFEMIASNDGTATPINANVGTGNPLADGAIGWMRMTFESDNGGGNARVVVYYAADTGNNTPPTSWTSLGSNTAAAAFTLFNTTSPLYFCGNETAGMTGGRMYYAEVRQTLGGAAVAKYEPSLYTSGSTWTASTGEVWTLNGGATIVTRTKAYGDGVDDYSRSPLYAAPQPISRYSVIEQVSWTSGDYLIDGASAANGAGLIQTTSTPQLNINAGSSVAANTNLVLKTTGVTAGIYNGASSALRVNLGTATTGNAGAGVTNGTTLFASGASTAASFGNGSLSEMAVYLSADPEATQSSFALYASRKWSLGLTQ